MPPSKNSYQRASQLFTPRRGTQKVWFHFPRWFVYIWLNTACSGVKKLDPNVFFTIWYPAFWIKIGRTKRSFFYFFSRDNDFSLFILNLTYTAYFIILYYYSVLSLHWITVRNYETGGTPLKNSAPFSKLTGAPPLVYKMVGSRTIINGLLGAGGKANPRVLGQNLRIWDKRQK